MAERTVVLVDHDDTSLNGLCDVLRTNGFDVAAFTEFDAARKHLQFHSPGALITEIRLGSFNGLHLVLLAKQWSPHTSAFVYSAHTDEATRQDVELCGATYVERDHILSALVTSSGPLIESNFG